MRRAIEIGLPAVGLALLIVGTHFALAGTPPDRDMGDVYRIIYVHVPSAWVALIAYTVTLAASIVYLVRASLTADVIAEASAELGVLFNAVLLVTGSLWGKPTWGTYWDWDPRLTTAAIMLFAFLGYLALRRFVDSPEKRATWSAVVAIIIYADIPIVWFSVKWWNSLHQTQSSPATVSAPMVDALQINAVAFVFVYLWLLHRRVALGIARARLELTEPEA